MIKDWKTVWLKALGNLRMGKLQRGKVLAYFFYNLQEMESRVENMKRHDKGRLGRAFTSHLQSHLEGIEIHEECVVDLLHMRPQDKVLCAGCVVGKVYVCNYYQLGCQLCGHYYQFLPSSMHLYPQHKWLTLTTFVRSLVVTS